MLHEGLDWALCDTDSMAIAKPAAMSDAEFERRVEAIRGWFDDLNPYAHKTSLLKLEDVNFGLGNGKLTKELQPLYCLAVSAKRYALFNIANDGGIVLRKASAHGLGHFLPPYTEATAPLSIPAPEMGLNEIGVERWQYDLWHQVVRAALDGLPDQVNLDYHPNFNLPAASRYGATTPSLLSWFGAHNSNLHYADQVRPNNFLLEFSDRSDCNSWVPRILSNLWGFGFVPGKTVRLAEACCALRYGPIQRREKMLRSRYRSAHPSINSKKLQACFGSISSATREQVREWGLFRPRHYWSEARQGAGHTKYRKRVQPLGRAISPRARRKRADRLRVGRPTAKALN